MNRCYRRTIVTLVLMPLLVYPLLSLVLNRSLVDGDGSKVGNLDALALVRN